MNAFDEILSDILTARHLYIYGAGIYGFEISAAIERLYGIKTYAFISSSKKGDGSDDSFAGKPHLSIEELPEDIEEALIIVVTPPDYHADIGKLLDNRPYVRYMVMEQRIIYEFMRRFYGKEYSLLSIEELGYLEKEKKSTFEIFRAVSVNDRKLLSGCPKQPYTIPIQCGAALTDRRVEELTDSCGDNISEKNGSYSELTGLYKAIRISTADYIGLCHYRRYLELSEEDYKRIAGNQIDAVLPLPYYCFGDSGFQWRRYISGEDMEILAEAVDKKEVFLNALGKSFLYNHNMFIARRDVAKDYGDWLFGILGAAETLFRKRDGSLKPRLMGYLGEVLTSVYFTVNAEKLKIVHAYENWLV